MTAHTVKPTADGNPKAFQATAEPSIATAAFVQLSRLQQDVIHKREEGAPSTAHHADNAYTHPLTS